MWCSAGSSTSWWRGRPPPGDPEAVRAVRAAAGTGRRRRDCPLRGRQARARRGRVGPHGQVLAQEGGGDGAIGELHCRRCRCPRSPLLESIR